jgi:hypothetical protein
MTWDSGKAYGLDDLDAGSGDRPDLFCRPVHEALTIKSHLDLSCTSTIPSALAFTLHYCPLDNITSLCESYFKSFSL